MIWVDLSNQGRSSPVSQCLSYFPRAGGTVTNSGSTFWSLVQTQACTLIRWYVHIQRDHREGK